MRSKHTAESPHWIIHSLQQAWKKSSIGPEYSAFFLPVCFAERQQLIKMWQITAFRKWLWWNVLDTALLNLWKTFSKDLGQGRCFWGGRCSSSKLSLFHQSQAWEKLSWNTHHSRGWKVSSKLRGSKTFVKAKTIYSKLRSFSQSGGLKGFIKAEDTLPL